MRGLIDRSIDRLVDWSDTIDHRATERGEWRHGEWRHDMTQTDGRLRHARPAAAAAASPNDFIDRNTTAVCFRYISVWNPEQTYTKCWRGQRIWSGRNSTGSYRERKRVVNSGNSTDGRFGVNVYTEAPPNYLPCLAPDNRSELARIGRLGMVFKNPKSGKVQNVCFYVFLNFHRKL